MPDYETVRSLAGALQTGEQSTESLVSRALERAGESENVFIELDQGVLETASAIDGVRRAGINLPALSGIPVTLKDLFDVRGQVTLAGSRALAHDARPADRDCDVVASLRRSGLLFLGRVNMSEFAFSGMGMNPHFGTPKSIWDRDTGRLPGGSSSGSAVSVAEGIVPVTMGSDTAGSCRIPAAFNGIVGVKPSFNRLSLEGVYPLSPTSDAPGPLGVDVDSCFLLDQVLTNAWDGLGDLPQLTPDKVKGLSLLVPDGMVMDGLDEAVVKAFQASLDALTDAGAQVTVKAFEVVDDCVDMFMTRAVAGFEAYAHHRELLEKYADEYDPFVGQRIQSFGKVTKEDQARRYIDKANLRRLFEQGMSDGGYDAIVYPTTACVPPKIADAQNPEQTAKINLRCLRNTASANYYDGCAMSVPCNLPGEAPVGFMVASVHGDDDRLYRIGAGIERVLSSARGVK